MYIYKIIFNASFHFIIKFVIRCKVVVTFILKHNKVPTFLYFSDRAW